LIRKVYGADGLPNFEKKYYILKLPQPLSETAKELGLTETDFLRQGGGFFWVVVIVGVLCCASEAY